MSVAAEVDTGSPGRAPAAPWRLDVPLAMVLTAVPLLLFGHSGQLPLLLSVLMNAPLVFRRTWPTTSFALASLACLLQAVLYDRPVPGQLGFLVACYSLAGYASKAPVRFAGLAVATIAGPIAAWDWETPPSRTPAQLLVGGALLSGLACVCWVAGDLLRRRRLVVQRLAEQNLALRRDRDQRLQLAAQSERTRIARDMHDIVAHSLSVIVVQADGAAYAAAHDRSFDLDRARSALDTIADTAREALAETRHLVAVLRDATDTALPDLTPTADLADLPDLVDRLCTSGRRVELTRTGDLDAVPREAALAAYRIVQESLTNVLKHAGPGAAARVEVSHAAGLLTVNIEDDGAGAAFGEVAAGPADGDLPTGNGIVGMTERAASLGGRLTAGPRFGGGFRVTATLPIAARTSP